MAKNNKGSKTMKPYDEFLRDKEVNIQKSGFEPIYMPDVLFDFQRDLTAWAVRRGRSAIWAGTGLGKTAMQLAWSQNVHLHTNKPVLILAPLGVTAQTRNEAKNMLGLNIKVCMSGEDVINGINITNYEKLHKFDPWVFAGIALDESSCLKNFTAKTKQQLIDMFGNTDFKLCCSATPSPNDYTEIGNHAEFLNVCTRFEMLATYFVHDSGSTQKWRIKGHAEKEFFKWISMWAIMIEKPSDIGYSDQKMKLPPLHYFEHKVESETEHGELFVSPAQTLNERRIARRKSIDNRCALAAKINNSTNDQFLNWCDLNDESATLTKMIDGAVEVKGADSNETKEKNMLAFANGDIKKMVIKPKIAQFGLNWQSCHNMCFVGLSDSFEAFFQAVRRCYRFGQKHPVNVHIIISEREGNVLENIKRKEANAKAMLRKMVQHTSVNTVKEIRSTVVKIKSKTQSFIPPMFFETNERKAA